MGWLLTTSLGRFLASIAAVLVAILLLLHAGERRGARKQREKDSARDHTEAGRIRDRVDAARRRELRPGQIVFRD